MKTRVMDSPAKRLSLAAAVIIVLALVGAGIYIVFSNTPSLPVNGAKIIAAAHAYTRALIKNHASVPRTVPLQTLVDQGFLQRADIGSLEGLDAQIFLVGYGGGGPEVLMSVRLPDGTNLVLFANGVSQRVKQ